MRFNDHKYMLFFEMNFIFLNDFWIKLFYRDIKIIAKPVNLCLYIYVCMYVYVYMDIYLCPYIHIYIEYMQKRLPAMQETWVRSLGQEDPLEKEMAIYPSTLAWKIPWTEKPSRPQSMGSQRVGHDWATSLTPVCEYFLCKGSPWGRKE